MPFLLALAPVWAVEALATAAVHALGPEPADALLIVVSVASAIVLPLIAGYRLFKRRGTVALSAVGGASISLATLATVAAIYAVVSAPVEAFLGMLIATAAFAVVPQLLFGVVGFKWAQRRAIGDI